VTAGLDGEFDSTVQLEVNPRETGLTGPPWREIRVISDRFSIVSQPNALNVALQTRPGPGIYCPGGIAT
jgi:hypothetical protein